jgi:hypothetical protein
MGGLASGGFAAAAEQGQAGESGAEKRQARGLGKQLQDRNAKTTPQLIARLSNDLGPWRVANL